MLSQRIHPSLLTVCFLQACVCHWALSSFDLLHAAQMEEREAQELTTLLTPEETPWGQRHIAQNNSSSQGDFQQKKFLYLICLSSEWETDSQRQQFSCKHFLKIPAGRNTKYLLSCGWWWEMLFICCEVWHAIYPDAKPPCRFWLTQEMRLQQSFGEHIFKITCNPLPMSPHLEPLQTKSSSVISALAMPIKEMHNSR